MGKYQKLQLEILRGTSDANVSFVMLCRLLERLGFVQRIRGDHHVFTKQGVAEIINIQPKGHNAKPYQVKRIRGILVKYRLGNTDVD
jgi:hypothetical protein